jgi:hypothetical protein
MIRSDLRLAEGMTLLTQVKLILNRSVKDLPMATVYYCILFTISGSYVKQDMGIPVKILIIVFLLIFALSGC